ncbi:ketosamine-3-kinase-like isoform X2 [Rhinatrema bivittatum]|uniref:ketosamine-3-kinase-like isoform X2 n=1 Tax=Rhinatrema bivittatum TaxID=194408 RepID=UPI001126CE1F|nr:ketosamine-3-kinase-like isoform X2 [Rhinatrema bivittatum]
MEALLREALGTSVLAPTGHSGGGCISQGQSYRTDKGSVFVKINHKPEARRMFVGEMASLEAILQTKTVTVPKPIKVIDMPGGGSAFVMEHLEMRSLNRHSAQLGEKLADLHLHNQRLGEKLKKEGGTVGKGAGQSEPKFIDKFGFSAITCCGYLPQMKIPEMFKDIEIVPALLHGDLWGGNVAEDDIGPIIFDPASFYGHSEYELGIAGMFGGFGSTFYSAYHSKIPKAPGFEKRLKLYQLFHYMNHWNHFGSGYRGSSLSIMRNLVK